VHFTPEFNLGNVVTIVVLAITFFSKSGRWFVIVDKKLDEISKVHRHLKREVDRNGRNNNAVREYAQSVTRILSTKYPDTYWPELKWHDRTENSPADKE
jgi:predicted RNase H-related nuclease YkuK (DUF458 family)